MRGNPNMSSDWVRPMTEVEASVVLDFCSCAGNSWPGNYQIWHNLARETAVVDNPISAGPLYLGGSLLVSSGDPTYVGRAGQKGGYFSLNGSQFFLFSGYTTANLADGLWGNIHKTTGGQAGTILMFMKYVASGTLQTIFTTKATGTNKGLTGYIGTNGKLNLSQRGDSAPVTVTSTNALTDGEHVVVGFGWDGTDCTFWVQSATGETVAMAFDTTIAACSNPLVFGLTFDSTITTGSFLLANGTEVYDIIGCDDLLDDTKVGNIIAEVLARTGIDFTP